MATVLAAGTVPWRRRRGRLQVALVHRPKYDDWSWAKGKLDLGESFPGAAARETFEETGLRVALGQPLATATYTLDTPNGTAAKEVRYWSAEVTGGDGELVNEVDDVAWLDAGEAVERLTHPRDRAQVDALVEADASGSLSTWPLAVVRHAQATPKSAWEAPDWQRPLDASGRTQADDLVPLLSAFGVQRLVSSPSTRASDTLTPFAGATGHRLLLFPELSEEGFAEEPGRAARHLRRLLEQGVPAALCSHRTVLPDLVAGIRDRVDATSEAGGVVRSVLEDVVTGGMTKGEALLAHVAGTGEAARVVAVERHHPHDRG